MNSLRLGRRALRNCSTLAIAAILAGCGALRQGDMPPIAGSAAMPATSSAYRVLYRFDRHPYGEGAASGLIDIGGELYGATREGGGAGCGRLGCGTVYRISTSGALTSIFGFIGKEDGENPQAGLIDVGGTLYGSMTRGGPVFGDHGGVYSISTAGALKVLYSFRGLASPIAPLIDVNGTLYGTAYDGGTGRSQCSDLCGGVYSVSRSGVEKTLYRFKGGASSDGAHPIAGLIKVNGLLYGTTSGGGGSDLGYGTVYSITVKGVEKVVYHFTGGSDGAHPHAALIDVGGTLYGTTSAGGSYGHGTVFSITTSGSEKVLYSFAGGSDGADPEAGLIDVKGTLYGTTYGGGAVCNGSGCGTVYAISTAGAERVLHSFAGGSDGMWPLAPLLDVKGTLYGTTTRGGKPHLHPPYCCGTIFSLRR